MVIVFSYATPALAFNPITSLTDFFYKTFFTPTTIQVIIPATLAPVQKTTPPVVVIGNPTSIIQKVSDATVLSILQRLISQPNILNKLRGPQGFQGPQGSVNSFAYNFPNTDGTNGDVLHTNGSGVLSWGSDRMGGGGGGSSTTNNYNSQWTTDSSNIYFNTGSVGIGTTTPAKTLDVTGTGNFSGALTALSFNGLTITGNGTNTLNITAGKSLIVSNILTLAGTDNSTLNIGTGGTLGTAAFTNSTAYEVPLTFGTGFTRSINTITNNLLTGISGGQIAVGGTGVADILSLKGTTGNGTLTSPAINFLVGNNGATNALTILNNGNVGIGITNPQVSLFNNGDFITKGPFADVRAFGAKGDGVTDDTSAVQAALNASLNVYFPAGTYLVSNLTPRNNQRIFGDGTSSSLQFKTGSTGYLFEDSTYSVQFTNLDLDGGTNTDQSGTVTAGNRSGIHVSALLPNNSITNVSVHGFSNIGIGLNGTGSLAGYPGAPTISGVNVYYNYTGIDTGVGAGVGVTNGAEYLKISDVTAYQNRIGIIINSGNNTITGSHFDTNGYGVKITDAYNNAHGSITGSTINHNILYGFYIDGATNGFSITGNQNWFSNVYVNNSTGINFASNTFGNSTFTLTGGGTNFLKNNWFTGAPTITRSSDNFIFGGNYYGASSTPVTGGNRFDGPVGIGYDPIGLYAPNGINVYAPNVFAGTSAGGAVPSQCCNVAITTSDVGGINVGGVLGLGGKYQTGTPTYNQIIFGGLKGGKSNATSGNFDGYLGIYTNKTAVFREVARFTEDGYFGIGMTPTHQLQLSTDDAAKPTSNTWTIVSDERLKQNIQNFNDGLNVISQINPVSYELNGKAGTPLGAKGIGVIAQDVKDIIPYTISTFQAKLNLGDTTDTTLYDFNSSALTFVSINAIKELNLNLEGVAGTITPLEGSATETFVTAFFNNVKTKIGAWLADAGNGITNIFAGTITVHNANIDNLCVKKSNGTDVCITGDQLDSLLAGASGSGSGSGSDSSSGGGSTSVATCSDNIQNQDETGVDTGGVCTPAVTLSSIAITTPATKLSYIVGDTLDFIGLVVTGTYSDATTKVETFTATDVSGFDSTTPATGQTLTIAVGGKTITYTIDVVALVQ